MNSKVICGKMNLQGLFKNRPRFIILIELKFSRTQFLTLFHSVFPPVATFLSHFHQKDICCYFVRNCLQFVILWQLHTYTWLICKKVFGTSWYATLFPFMDRGFESRGKLYFFSSVLHEWIIFLRKVLIFYPWRYIPWF